MERNQASSSWITKAIVYTLVSSFTGIVAGGLLGAAGGLLSFEYRIVIASLLGAIAVILGSLEIAGHRVRLPQLDHETPQSWMNVGPVRWAARNGFTLGLGAISRIGFPLWYSIPVGAFLIGRPGLGIVVYGTYSTVRAMAVWALIPGGSRLLGKGYQDWLIEHNGAARILTSAQLLLLGVVVIVTIGL